jgi:hypothetical protein
MLVAIYADNMMLFTFKATVLLCQHLQFYVEALASFVNGPSPYRSKEQGAFYNEEMPCAADSVNF